MAISKKSLRLIETMKNEGRVIVRGHQDLLALRSSLHELMRAAGLKVVFDDTSDPTLVDFLSVGALGGVEGAIIGSVLGTLIGLLFGAPAKVAAVGLAIGAGAGVLNGLSKVQGGWRIRAVRDSSGAPIVELQAAA